MRPVTGCCDDMRFFFSNIAAPVSWPYPKALWTRCQKKRVKCLQAGNSRQNRHIRTGSKAGLGISCAAVRPSPPRDFSPQARRQDISGPKVLPPIRALSPSRNNTPIVYGLASCWGSLNLLKLLGLFHIIVAFKLRFFWLSNKKGC